MLARSLNRVKKSQLAQRIRHGVPDDELRSPFEWAAVPAYGVVGLFLIGLSFSFAMTDFDLDSRGLLSAQAMLASLIVGGLALRRYGHLRLAGAIETVGLLGIVGLLAVFALAVLSATNLPLADEALIRADAMLGFSWIDFIHRLEGEDLLIDVLVASYRSIQWQPILLAIVLMIANQQKRLWTFLNGWVLGLALTVLLFPFFPAIAAINYHGLSAEPGVHTADFVDWMQGIRDGSIRVIDHASVRGIVTFPSFHASAAIYFAWGFARVGFLRWPLIALNLLMLFATLVIGGHYLVDILGGIVIAIATIAIADKAVAKLSSPQ